ncbi:MAG: leucine-rich repeat domain-containing protein [Candidatus Thorarchaeota archaeon]
MKDKIGSESVLLRSETANLNNLQAQLQKPFPQIDDLQFEDQGYIIEGAYVVGLKLQNMELTALPDNLNKFYQLKHLYLSQNTFSSLDLDPLYGSSSLELLELDQCGLERLDLTPLQECRNLAILKLSQNQIKSIDLSPLQHCQQLEFLKLDNNQLKTIDLTPLTDCTKIGHLNLNNNQLQDVNLNFLDKTTTLRTLGLAGNPLTKLDITLLLFQSNFSDLNIDFEIPLSLSPVHRNYALNHHWFTSEFLPRVNWILPKEDLPYRDLFQRYQNIIRYFRHEEYWPDYRDRRLKTPPENSDEVRFFEYLVERYMEIKDRPCSEYFAKEQKVRREQLLSRVQDRFLGSDALGAMLKDYFEPYNEPRVTVSLIEDALQNLLRILLLHYWPTHSPSQLRLVQTITWIKVDIDDPNQCYHLHFGFNRGRQQAGQKFHPVSPPKEYPPDVITTTEVMYEVKSLTTSNLLELLEQCREWLQRSFYPKFDSVWPKGIYWSSARQPNF